MQLLTAGQPARAADMPADSGARVVHAADDEGLACDSADTRMALVGRTIADVERDLIIDTLKHCLGNRTHAANILGISIRTLRNKLSDYAAKGISVPAPRAPRLPSATRRAPFSPASGRGWGASAAGLYEVDKG